MITRTFYEAEDNLPNTPYAVINRWDSYVEDNTQIGISCQELDNFSDEQLHCKEVLNTLHPREEGYTSYAKEPTYSMHKDGTAMDITQAFYNSLLSRSRKRQLYTTINCYRTGKHSMIKIGKIQVREDNGHYVCKFTYAEVVQDNSVQYDSLQTKYMERISKNWKPIENLDQIRYEIFQAQETTI